MTREFRAYEERLKLAQGQKLAISGRVREAKTKLDDLVNDFGAYVQKRHGAVCDLEVLRPSPAG